MSQTIDNFLVFIHEMAIEANQEEKFLAIQTPQELQQFTETLAKELHKEQELEDWLEQVEDERILQLVENRLKNADTEKSIPLEEVMKKFRISSNDVANVDVEIE